MPASDSWPYIPERSPDSTHRTLVLLFDGTGDKRDADVTNVFHLRNMLLSSDKQLVYYQRGIGTFFPGFRESDLYIPILTPISRMIDQAIAWSLPYHVMEGYRWLMKQYKAGDKISFFGFSRGAYVARALAGMLRVISLLPYDRLDKADEAYALYARKLPKAKVQKDTTFQEAWDELMADVEVFKKVNACVPVRIDFLGCWDTVNSVGLVRPIKLKFTAKNDIVRVFRHALALDEHRVRFKPNLWGKPQEQKELEVVPDVEEVWFAGCHCDVGGGAVPNHTRPNLSHIPLRWMIRECFKTKTEIMFNSRKLKVLGIEPSHLYPEVLPRPDREPVRTSDAILPPYVPSGLNAIAAWLYILLPFAPPPVPTDLPPVLPERSEEEHDLRDCLAPIYDQLEIGSWVWHLMEHLPLITEVFKTDAKFPELQFKEEREAHLGVGRTVPSACASHGNKIKIHRTVKMRMQARMENSDEKYVPQARVGYGVKDEFTKANPDDFEWVA